MQDQVEGQVQEKEEATELAEPEAQEEAPEPVQAGAEEEPEEEAQAPEPVQAGAGEEPEEEAEAPEPVQAGAEEEPEEEAEAPEPVQAGAEEEPEEEAEAPEPVQVSAQEKAEEEAEAPAAEEASEPEEEQAPERAWYVVHTYSGYEKKVQRNLQHRIESMGMQDQVFQIVMPVEEEVDIREGQRRIVERKIFPGYILIEMVMNDHSWSLVRNTPGVTGFVGSGARPMPLPQADVDRILRRMETEEPKVRVSFRKGQTVRIVDGPFTEFHGIVDDIDAERGRVRLLLSFFGRETPVELDFLQVEKG